jgi:RNA 2',3'-cyclic 3'-phosphodiesterase
MIGKTHRVFVAVDFSSEVVKEVARVHGLLGNVKFFGKLTELENLHLSLKFLGEVDSEKLRFVKEKLKEVKFKDFEARLGEIGIFSYKGSPRIVWVKVIGKGIFDLQEKVDSVLEGEGLVREARFMSHMTIARVKFVKDVQAFREYIEGIKLRDIRFRVENFKLIESELREIGPVYRELGVYRGK